MLLDGLKSGGVVAVTADEPRGYLPARDLGTVSAKQLLDLVRGSGGDRYLDVRALPAPEPVEEMLRRIDRATDAALENMTAEDLAGAHPAPPQPSVAAEPTDR